MNLFSNRSSVGVKSYNSVFRLLFVLLLVAALPVFIWAVLTQRIELRKRASTSEPTQICWNRVIPFNGSYAWPNGCKGDPRTDIACTEAIVSLTPSELNEYNQWVATGRPYIPGCGGPTPTPTPRPFSINWTTPYASLQADDITIIANGKAFKAQNVGAVSVHSDPGNRDYTTLEMIWQENGVEMRLFMYFWAGIYPESNSTDRVWGISEVRTYNGNAQGDWIYYRNRMPLASIGNASQGGDFTLRSDSNNNLSGEIRFTNYRLQAFLNQSQIPPGCHYQQVQCFQAPCEPILVCSSTTPTPPDQCNGPNGSRCEITNCPVYDCPPGQMCAEIMRPCTIMIGTCQRRRCVAQRPTPTPTCTPRPACMDPLPGQPVCMVDLAPGAWLCPRRPTPTPTTSPTPTPISSQTMTFKVKLAGVDGAQAEGSKISVKFYLQNGSVVQLPAPITLSHVGNGVYQTSVIVTNPFSDRGYTVKIKGEKHIAVTFCRLSGQTGPCEDNEGMVSVGIPQTVMFDFTGIALPPGDLAPQDGRADQSDIDKLKNLMTKPSTSLTTGDKLTGDLNYDGTINGFDLFLILQTLRTRYDG